MSDMVEESQVQHALADILYHVEHEGKLPEFWNFILFCYVDIFIPE